MTNAEMLNDVKQLLPTVFIEQVTLEEGGFKNVQVSATFSLKDVVEKDGISQWFAQEDFTKFIKFYVLAFKSEELFQNVFNSLYLKKEASFLFPDVVNEEIQNFSIQTINNIVADNPTSVFKFTPPIPTRQELEKNDGIFYSENFIVDKDDGTQEITIPIKVQLRFPFDEEVDKYLSVLSFLTFDLKSFAANFNISDENLESDVLSQSFSNVEVLKDGAVVSTVQYFILPNGNFYYGQFHVIQNPDKTITYKTGIVETPESEILQIVTDTNNIVTDLRSRKFFGEIEKLDQTGLLNNFIKNEIQIKKAFDKIKTNKNTLSKYFSETYVSTDEQGNCRFSFFFDKQKFIIDNSFYPQIFITNPNLIAEKVIIKNISIFRIRKDIKEINLISENPSVLVASNSVIVAENADVLQLPDVEKNDGSYIAENSVEGIDFLNIKNYSVLDAQTSDINYGIYKYKVLMEIIDPTKQYLKTIFDSLNNVDGIVQKLQNYYQVSLSSRRQIVDSVISGNDQKTVKFIPYFNTLTGKFNQEFLKDNLQLAESAQDALKVFLSFAKEFGYYSFTSESEEKEFYKNLNNFLSPPSASPETISIIVEIVKDFSKKIQELLEISDSQKASNTSSKYKNNLLTIEYTFDSSLSNELGFQKQFNVEQEYENYFNATIVNGAGYKIINPSANFLGLSSMGVEDYKNLTNLIVQKHFNDYQTINIKNYYGNSVIDIYDFDDEIVNDDSRYSFLPALSVGTINKKYELSNLSNTFLNQKYFLNMFLDIINYNTIKQSNFSNQSITEQLLDLFTDNYFSNVSVAPEQPNKAAENKEEKSFNNLFGKKTPPEISKIDPQITQIKDYSIISNLNLKSEPNSLLIDLLIKQIINKEQVSFAKDFSIFNPLNSNIDPLNPTSVKNNDFFLDKIIATAFLLSLIPNSEDYVQTVQNYIKNLPIPIKHLIVSRGEIPNVVKAYEDNNNIKDATKYPENFFKYWINFKQLYEIQYFDGFESDNIKIPVWKTLTVDKLESSTANIFCRINKYKLPSFEEYFPDIKKLEMPILDKYFYIVPNNSVQLIDEIQKQILIPTNAPVDLPPIKEDKADKIGAGSNYSISIATKIATGSPI